MTSKYIPSIPSIYKVQSINVDDVYKDLSVLSSSNINQPLFSLGFHSFIHRTKSAMEITTKLETKNKFYYIVNPFEQTINDYTDDISHIVAKYLSIANNEFISRSFFKMWEILQTFNLANQPSMTMVGLAEAPGSFVQAFIKYREKLHDITKDRIHVMSIESKDISISDELVKNTKKYPKLLNIITSKLETGDLSHVSTTKYIKTIIDNEKRYADLITADGEVARSINNNYSEQDSYALILGEIITALKIQAINGSFVLKVFETFTCITIKMIYLLSSFYENVYIYKPFFSRDTTSEKYIICTKFKYEQKDKSLDKKIILLENTLSKMDTKMFIIDIFPKFKLTTPQLNLFKFTNILFANRMQIIINKLVTYIKSNNYFGDEYHAYRIHQIEACKWWVNLYLTEAPIIDSFAEVLKTTISYNESELNLFVMKLLHDPALL